MSSAAPPDDDPSLIDQATLDIVNTLGDRSKVSYPVRTPATSQQLRPDQPGRAEQNTYEWFSRNERAGRPQALGPVKKGEPLPFLDSQ
ncbi:MAG: hypothetical protein HZA24_05880 [Nitrospirae bacterium]|nr:hypothetical protein [Nitrospirota bacterium]